MMTKTSNTVCAVRWFPVACLAASIGFSPFAFADDSPSPPLSKGWQFAAQDGKALYQSVCQACHMPAGQGAEGAGMYPALANNARLASSGYIVDNVLNGRKGMPGLGIFLSDAQVVAVTTYVRTNMGNNYRDPVTLEEVAKLRRPAKGLFDD